MQRVIDRRFLAKSLVLALLLVGLIAGTHRYQLYRLSGQLRSEATRNRDAGNFGREARMLYSYLQLHPAEPEVLADLAVATDRSGTSIGTANSAIQWYYQSLGHLPDRIDLRGRLAELLLKVGRVAEAAQEAEAALSKNQQDPVSLRVQAIAKYRDARNSASKSRISEAISTLETAHANLPAAHDVVETLIEAYEFQGLDQDGGGTKATEALHQLVASAADARSHIVRARYRLRNNFPGVSEDLHAAADLSPKDPSSWLAVAIGAHRSGEIPLAIKSYTRLRDLAPTNVQAYIGLGECERATGDTDAAQKTWESGLQNCPRDQFPLLSRIAELHLDLGDAQAARIFLDRSATDLAQQVPTFENRAQRVKWQQTWSLLEGRWLVSQHRWIEAETAIATVLYENVSDAEDDIGSHWRERTARLTVAEIYRQTGRTKEAGEVFSQLAKSNSADAPRALLSSGMSFAEKSDIERAIKICEKALEHTDPPAEGWLLLASLQLEKLARENPGDRDWSTFDRSVRKYQAVSPVSWKATLLRAQAVLLRNPRQVAPALGMLKQNEATWTHDAEAWAHIAAFTSRLGEIDVAQQAAERYFTLIDDPASRSHFQALLALQRDDVTSASKILDQIPANNLSSTEQQVANAELRRHIYARMGNWPAERNSLSSLVKHDAADPNHLRQLVQRSWEMNEPLDDLLNQLIAQEGSNSPYVAITSIRAWSQKNPNSPLDDPAAIPADIQERMESLRRHYSEWPVRLIMLGELAERHGTNLDAANYYLQVAKSGYLSTYYRALALRCLLTEETWPAAMVVLETTDWNESATLVSSDAKYSPTVQDQLLRALRESQLSAGRQTNDSSMARWNLVVATLLKRGQGGTPPFPSSPDAQTLLAKYPHDQLSQLVGQWCIRSESSPNGPMDPLPTASKQSSTAWDAEHKLLAGEPQQARDLYLHLLDRQDSVPTPRLWALQLRYASLLDHTATEERQSLWKTVVKIPHASETARLFARQFPSLGESLHHATQGIDGQTSFHVGQDVPEQRLLFADELEKNGQLQAARAEYERLLTGDPQFAIHVAYTRFLVRTQDWLELAKQLPHLSALQSEAWETTWATAHVKFHEGRVSEAMQEIDSAVQRMLASDQDPMSLAQDLARAAELYTDLDANDFAQQVYGLLIEQVPYHITGLAMSLGKEERWQDATALCRAGIDTEHDYLAILSLAKLAELPVPIDILESQVLPEVEKKLSLYGDRAEFLFHLSNIRIRQLNSPEAIALLRQVTELDPGHVIAWNNLAALLAESPATQTEAKRCAEHAISLTAEPLATVLDTLALVHLHRGNLAEATQLLERVTTSFQGDDPRFHFHLAWVYQLQNDREMAAMALTKAQQLDLPTRYLTQLEQNRYEQLKAELTP